MRRHTHEHVRYGGYLPFEELMRRLPGYDLAFASAAGRIPFTSKLYHYLNAGLPLLAASPDDALRRFVRKHDIGLACALEPVALSQALEQIADDPSALLRWRHNVLAIRGDYSLARQVSRLSELLAGLIEGAA